MKKLFLLIGLIAAPMLGACSSGTGVSDAGARAAGEEPARLSADYDDALSVEAQLALGTVRLEETEQAVDEAQAAELLPLWRALQSLSSSDTAAAAELEAVVNQIQDTMTPAQIEAIAGMALTTDTVAELIESGELAPAGLGQRAAGGEVGSAGGSVSLPPGGFPPGGFAGGGPPGGAFPGGLGAAGNLSQDDIATRQAEFESGESGGFEERLLLNLTIRLLAEKTGEEIENPGQAIADAVFGVVSEATSVSVEEIQAQAAEGATLAEIAEANGVAVADVRPAIVEALSALPNAAELDVEQIADQWLGLAE
jgi:uncharacterized protein (DUF433 family)